MIDDKLNLGSGLRPKPKNEGWINLDMFDLPGVDVIFDLDEIGRTGSMSDRYFLPFDSEQFSYIHAEDVLEHVTDIVKVMRELWRVMKPGATLWIRGPDARYPEQVWADPTHKRAFAKRSFDNWDRSTYDGCHYGYYFHQNKYYFHVELIKEVNKGMEYTLIKEV